MTIPEPTLKLHAKLSDQWANRSWDDLEDAYGSPISHIEYARLAAKDRADVTNVYTDVKEYMLDNHNVYFMRHMSGAVHLTCAHVDDYVTIDDQNRIAYESRTAGTAEIWARLVLSIRNFLRRWDVFRRPL